MDIDLLNKSITLPVPLTVTEEIDAFLATIEGVTCEKTLLYKAISATAATYLVRPRFGGLFYLDFTLDFDQNDSERFMRLKKLLLKEIMGAMLNLDETDSRLQNAVISLWRIVKPVYTDIGIMIGQFLKQRRLKPALLTKVAFYYSLLGRRQQREGLDLLVKRLAISTHSHYLSYGDHHMKYFAIIDSLDQLPILEIQRLLCSIVYIQPYHDEEAIYAIESFPPVNLATELKLTRYYIGHRDPFFRNLMWKLFGYDFWVRLTLFNDWFMLDITWLLMSHFVTALIK